MSVAIAGEPDRYPEGNRHFDVARFENRDHLEN